MTCGQVRSSTGLADFCNLFTHGRKWLFAISMAAGSLTLVSGAVAKQDAILYSFAGGTDAQNPLYESLCIDKNGNLYGTTDRAGANGLGTVFKVAPDGSETVIHSFAGSLDGSHPFGGVIVDATGNLYGTTSAGGSSDDGTVYKLAPDGTFTVLYSFNSGYEAGPRGGLLRDKKGNLYGTTDENYGIAFRLSPRGKYIVLHSFDYNEDGDSPLGNLIMDGSGSLYGVTNDGGTGGWGTVFKIAADGTFAVLHAFSGGTDGSLPEAGLVMDGAGNLYGTTAAGAGNGGQTGTVFKIALDGTETILTDFGGGNVSYAPAATLVLDDAGNLYGTTAEGGSIANCTLGCGTVFQLAPDGTLRFLHKFQGGTADGAWPYGGVILHKGYLFGTTYGWGGSQVGTVFQLKK
jgi:uncharacterized repeat protein (TIGR03803 family)